MNAVATGRNGIRRMGALVCLFALCLGPSRLLPLAFALAASLEGSHTVLLQEEAEGTTKVVLSHERAQRQRVDYTPAHDPHGALHHHGEVSQIICFIAGAGAREETDHVASFPNGRVVEETQKGTL